MSEFIDDQVVQTADVGEEGVDDAKKRPEHGAFGGEPLDDSPRSKEECEDYCDV